MLSSQLFMPFTHKKLPEKKKSLQYYQGAFKNGQGLSYEPSQVQLGHGRLLSSAQAYVDKWSVRNHQYMRKYREQQMMVEYLNTTHTIHIKMCPGPEAHKWHQYVGAHGTLRMSFLSSLISFMLLFSLPHNQMKKKECCYLLANLQDLKRTLLQYCRQTLEKAINLRAFRGGLKDSFMYYCKWQQ